MTTHFGQFLSTPRAGRLCTAILLASLFSTQAVAATRLVKPQDSWDDFAAKLSPGDEVVLMPGKHKPITLTGVHGEQGKPIVIRGLKAQAPSTIEASQFGVQLHGCQHVELRDLVIDGASINGILADDDPRAADGSPLECGLVIRGVTVQRTGPDGPRDAIRLVGLTDVLIESVTVDGWGGAAIGLVACKNVHVKELSARSQPDHSQLSGISMRSGCEQVRITGCRIQGAAAAGISVGGTTDFADFRPPIPELVSPGSIAEVRGLMIDRCLFDLCARPFDFAHASQWAVRQCTIVRPADLVLALRVEQSHDRFDRGGDGQFASNLIMWEPGDIARLVFVDEKINLRKFELGRNLLWSSQTPEQRQTLGSLPGKNAEKQTSFFDPHLDENLNPLTPEARGFGFRQD